MDTLNKLFYGDKLGILNKVTLLMKLENNTPKLKLIRFKFLMELY